MKPCQRSRPWRQLHGARHTLGSLRKHLVASPAWLWAPSYFFFTFLLQLFCPQSYQSLPPQTQHVGFHRPYSCPHRRWCRGCYLCISICPIDDWTHIDPDRCDGGYGAGTLTRFQCSRRRIQSLYTDMAGEHCTPPQNPFPLSKSNMRFVLTDWIIVGLQLGCRRPEYAISG